MITIENNEDNREDIAREYVSYLSQIEVIGHVVNDIKEKMEKDDQVFKHYAEETLDKQDIGDKMCTDGWDNRDQTNEIFTCPDCDGDVDCDGDAIEGCNHSPINCYTCMSAPCDQYCQKGYTMSAFGDGTFKQELLDTIKDMSGYYKLSTQETISEALYVLSVLVRDSLTTEEIKLEAKEKAKKELIKELIKELTN